MDKRIEVVRAVLSELETALAMTPERRREYYGTLSLSLMLNSARAMLTSLEFKGEPHGMRSARPGDGMDASV